MLVLAAVCISAGLSVLARSSGLDGMVLWENEGRRPYVALSYGGYEGVFGVLEALQSNRTQDSISRKVKETWSTTSPR